MISVTLDQLKKDDVIQFTEKGDPHTVKHISAYSPDKFNLLHVELCGGGTDHIRANVKMEVLAVKMIREIEVPCRAVRHERGPYRMLHDFAKGAAPFAVICGQCDEEITAEVEVAMKEPRRHDTVLIGDRELKIVGFCEDDGTRLNNGQRICASKLSYVSERTWRYHPKKESN